MNLITRQKGQKHINFPSFDCFNNSNPMTLIANKKTPLGWNEMKGQKASSTDLRFDMYCMCMVHVCNHSDSL